MRDPESGCEESIRYSNSLSRLPLLPTAAVRSLSGDEAR